MRENVLKFIVDDVRRTVENQLTWPMNVSPPRRKVWRPHLFSIFVFRRVSAPVNVPKITRKWNPSAILMFTRLGGGVVRPPIATLSPPAPTLCYPNYPVLVSLSLIYWLLLVYYCYYYCYYYYYHCYDTIKIPIFTNIFFLDRPRNVHVNYIITATTTSKEWQHFIL